MAVKLRGKITWDPVLIVFQILTIQFLSYASLTLLILFTTSLSGYPASTAFMFNYQVFRLTTSKLVIIAHLVNPFISAYLLRVFVERSKSCLDFSITYYFMNFLLVWYYSRGIPDTFIWYFVNSVAACIMCVMGEYLCRKEELKVIPLSALV